MRILGISAFYHDSAAALIDDGRIVAAAQEERFSRIKHDAGFPEQAARFCLTEAGGRLDNIDLVVFYEKPFLKFERLIETYLGFAPKGFRSFRTAMPVWLTDKLFQKKHLLERLEGLTERDGWDDRLLFTEHHMSHAASAFYPSPFDEALVLALDGVGEWTTSSAWLGRGNTLIALKELHFPHSLGLAYSAFTYFCGFKVNSGEYKLMGLAPYGTPRFRDLIFDRLIDLKDDGSFRLDQAYFDYSTGLTMTNRRFAELFGAEPRRPDAPLTELHMDLAASIQAVTEEIVLRIARTLRRETGQSRLCLAGGVALNCVANGKLRKSGLFDDIWVQPAAGDAGGAIGAALAAWHEFTGAPRPTAAADRMAGAYLGPAYDQAEIERRLKAAGAVFTVLGDDDLIDRCAASLAAGKALGWHQGRMEFGPRALGNRSILADPRRPEMQRTLNLKVKFRESFRPFAPSVLREDVTDWFEWDTDSPYMLMVAPVAAGRHQALPSSAARGLDRLHEIRSEIPAVTHVDGSARIQTVHDDTNPRFAALLRRFKALTGCPVLVNTSFNIRGEPIVAAPEDAFRCFMGTEIETLAVGNCFLDKADQDPGLKRDYTETFELD